MKLRIIILILSTLGILAIAFGGYFYYASQRRIAVSKADREASLRAAALSERLSAHLAMNLSAVRFLAGQEELKTFLSRGDERSRNRAELTLDHFCSSLKDEVCYLMDSKGITLASTNRHAPDSFVGKDYSFRPYFSMAMAGTPTVYLALGVTSGRRGIYLSQPVIDSPAAPPVGVVVAKASPEFLSIGKEDEGIWTLTSPEGIIFASNRNEWLFKSMKALLPEEREELSRSKQFGTGDWESIGITAVGPGRAQDARGKVFILREAMVDNAPGWKVDYLVALDKVVKDFSSPLIGTTGFIIAICSLLSFTSLFLYLRGNREITQRIREEKALMARHAEELKKKVAELDREVLERKKAQMEVQELNLTLEGQVVERTSRLKEANEEMEAFVYTVSHDLRSPLRGIGGLLGIIQEDFSGHFPPEARKLFAMISENCRRMAHLIDGLLAFSRLGRQQLAKQKTDAGKLVKDVLAELKREAEGRHVEFVVGEFPPCLADPFLLRVVFSNLIGNALKFTVRREIARIEIGSFGEGNRHIFYVRDNGAGFDMRYSDKLFGVFQRLHSDREFEGTGIGLATVKKIIQRHGGSVWAEAEVNKGATFYFTLGEG